MGGSQPGAIVEVMAPARLHLGFLDLDGGLGRRFGSLGLAVEGIGTSLTLGLATGTQDQAEGAEAARAMRVLATLRQSLPLPPLAVVLRRTIPPHAGLGSGTQLGLALGLAATCLTGQPLTPPEIATRVERGMRSGIGVGAFASGGVVLDGGKGDGPAPPPIVGRVAFPAAWRMLLVMDGARQGLSGEAERGAFAALPPFGAELAGRLTRLAVMQFLPGVATADLAAAAAALGTIQALLGDYFAPVQGGARFTSAAVGEALGYVAGQGFAGIGQSSWGPTGFALLPDATTAAALADAVRHRWPGLAAVVVAGRNHGASVAGPRPAAPALDPLAHAGRPGPGDPFP